MDGSATSQLVGGDSSQPPVSAIDHCVTEAAVYCASMRWLLLLWLALTLSLVTAQGPVAISRRYQPMTVFPPPELARHRCHIQQLAVTRRYLETIAARLSLDVRGLLAARRHSSVQLRESSAQGKCDCESADLLTTPTPTPAQPASPPEAGNSLTPNGSWQLKPTEAASDSTAAASSHSGSFFSSTMFVLAVFFMAVPVACVIGFVLFCKRRRRHQHTHA